MSVGARPFSDLKPNKRILKSILKLTDNQCRGFKMGVIYVPSVWSSSGLYYTAFKLRFVILYTFTKEKVLKKY